jgi:AraC family transcriptional regulator, transcriptional activator of pobA
MMDHLIRIFKLSKEEAKKISESPDVPHNHDFEELIVGMEGELGIELECSIGSRRCTCE